MAERDEASADVPKTIQEHEEYPGRFDSTLAEYPGYVRYPAPFMYSHFQKWWAESVGKIREANVLEWLHSDSQWKAARLLILEYGEWAIEGVTVGDAKDDNLPTEVVEFVTISARRYILPKLDPKKARVLSTVL